VENTTSTLEEYSPPSSPVKTFTNLASLNRFEKAGDIISDAYKLVSIIGKGAHSTVWRADQLSTGKTVAIKQLKFEGAQFFKRTYREIKILQHFISYEGAVTIYDLVTNSTKDNFNSLFIILEYCEMDLQKFLSKNSIGLDLVKNFTYQLVCALEILHEANVIHRDLKSQNILISCTDNHYVLKLCDFGTGRAEKTRLQDLRRTTLSDVTTTYYLAPEGILNKECYSNSVDVWALGCIIAELIKRTPLLRGNGSHRDQLRLIISVCGKPPPEELMKIPDSPEKEYVLKAEVVTFTLEEMLPGVDASLLEFIKQFLVFYPEKRISAAEALKHPFLASFSKNLNQISPFAPMIEKEKFSDDNWKDLLWDELMFYKNNNEA